MFPNAQPSLTNPSSSSDPSVLSHAQQHADANDNIEALCAKLGIGAATPIANRLLIGTGVGTSDWSKVSPNGTIVGTTDTQTITNKTLTSPTINTPTIVNPTLQTDTVSEYTGASGVTVDGLNIKDGALNTANSVPNSALSNTGAFGSAWDWVTYVPANNNVTVGNGTQTAKYTQIGKTVIVRYHLVFGTTTAISGDIQIGTPVTMKTYPGTAAAPPVGTCRAYDISGSAVYDGSAAWISTTRVCLRNFNAAGTYAVQTVNSSTVPFTWASTDELHAQFIIEAA